MQLCQIHYVENEELVRTNGKMCLFWGEGKFKARYVVLRIEEKTNMGSFKEIEIACINISGIRKETQRGDVRYIPKYVVAEIQDFWTAARFRANLFS